MTMDKKHILIAEDEKHIQLALGIILTQVKTVLQEYAAA